MKTKLHLFLFKLFLLFILFIPSMVSAQAVKDSIRRNYTQRDYEIFVQKEKRGEIPDGKGRVMSATTLDGLVNNNVGSTGTASFTQSETSILAYGSYVIIGYNDAGSFTGGANKFTGWSYSSDGGATFTDGGTLPTTAGGDAGDPVLARNETTGRIYYSTLGFDVPTIQIFRSDDNALTWMAPVNGTPGGAEEDKQWITVDNFAGSGNGNVYLVSRNFGAGNGIYFYRSLDDGATFGPIAGTFIVSGNQGAYVTVGPDHSVYVFWYNGTTIQMRKSTDQGLTFGPAVIVVSGLTGGTNGDLGLTGLRQGTASFASFRSNEFPHAAVNPVSGHLYVAFDDNPAGADKGNAYMVMSTDGGVTWSARTLVNDDATTADQWFPTIAVTPDGTKLGIFYYSRQGDPVNNNLFTYNARLATISGPTVTFTPSTVISDISSLPEFGRDAVVNSTYMGDYNSAVATNSDFHLVWSDNRDDLAGGAGRKDPNVYYKSIPTSLIVLAGPNIGVNPASINFGQVIVGESIGPILVTISNIGDENLTVSSITSPAADFSITAPTLPAVIPSLESITVQAYFAPLSAGAQSSSFTINSNALNDPSVIIDLDGEGLPRPENDLCENAIPLDCSATSIDGTTINGTFDNAGFCITSNTTAGVWYTLVGDGSSITLETCSAASYDTKISVFTGSCGNFTCVTGNDDFCTAFRSQVTFSSAEGTTYYILVHGFASQTGTFTLTYNLGCTPLISVSPADFTFNVLEGGTASDVLNISNVGTAGSTLNWNLTISDPLLPLNSTGNIPQYEEITAPKIIAPDYEYFIGEQTLRALEEQGFFENLGIRGKLEKIKDVRFADKEELFKTLEDLIPSGNPNLVTQIAINAEYRQPGNGNNFSRNTRSTGKTMPKEEPRLVSGDIQTSVSSGVTVTLTHSVNQSITEFNSVACSYGGIYHADNHHWRAFDPMDFGINTTFNVTEVEIGVELASSGSGSQPVTVNLYSSTGSPFPAGTLNLIGTATYGVADQALMMLTLPVVGTVPPGAELVVEIFTPNGSVGTNLFLIGSNNLGQTGPSYLSAPECGVSDPTNLTDLGYPASHIVMNVTGTYEPSCTWLSISPGAGSTADGTSSAVTVNVDATGLPIGSYLCELKVFSNDQNTNPVVVPVTLNVLDDPNRVPLSNWPLILAGLAISAIIIVRFRRII